MSRHKPMDVKILEANKDFDAAMNMAAVEDYYRGLASVRCAEY